MTNSKRLLSAAALCFYYTTSAIISTTAAVTTPYDDSSLPNIELQDEMATAAANGAKKRRLRGPHSKQHRSLQGITTATHPYYPNHTTLSCSDDGNPPSWMTWGGGYAEAHLFRTNNECCDKWFPDNEGCYDSGNVESTEQQKEEIVVENYHQRPVITSEESTTTSIRPTRPTNTEPQQQTEEVTTPTQPQQPEATFPTSSCGTTLFEAQDCTRLCLPGGTNTCLPEETCFSNVLCPAKQVAAAMGDAGSAILDLISVPDEVAEKTNTVNVCGVDYNDAESKCKNVVTGEVYMDASYIACPDGTGKECPNEMQCFGGILCPLPPTSSPTVRPTTSKPVAIIVSTTTTVEKKDKTEVVGLPPPPPPSPTTTNNYYPPSTSTSTTQDVSPYSIDKSTLGTVSVASESCNGGCPDSSKCVGNQAAGQLIEDSDCHPCSASGQTWWPCDVPGLCWCWKDGTDRIAPAPPSGLEVDTSLEEHYTVCDDILTREAFDEIAPNAQPPYTYTGLCDAILSYNAHHAEKFGVMGDAFHRASELAAFLGNTLHESAEFEAPREYLMCGDSKIVNGEVYCKPCDSGSYDWGTHKCSHSLASSAGFSEYCQSSSKPPEACSCDTVQGGGDGYVPAKEMFFGRGAIQLSWNYNYRGASTALTGDPDKFCENPDLVATEEKYAWGAGLYFWMEHVKEGTTSHIECLKNYNFGGTLNNINGGLECPAHGGWHAEAVILRLNRYCRAAKVLGLPNLLKIDGCAGLDEKFNSCVGDGSCAECSDYFGKNTGEHSYSYSPPDSSTFTTSGAERPATIEEKPSESPCPQGYFSWEKNPSCCVPNPNFIGDGACDPDAPYNTEVCGYDGGDCCKGTCFSGSIFGCTTKNESQFGDYGPFGFYCVDPSQEDSIDKNACTDVRKDSIGDGRCNPEYNTVGCNYDGGDCCEESCDTIHSFYQCGLGDSFDCRDPAFFSEAEADNPTHKPTPMPTVKSGSELTTVTVTSTPAPTKTSTPQPSKASTPPPTEEAFSPTSKAPTPSPPQTTCHKDMLECEGGTFVTRNPDDNCEFYACPPVEETSLACEDELLECPGGGHYVGRDPTNGCDFFPCPEPKPEPTEVESTETTTRCDEDFLRCSGGQLVFRNPEDSCNFFPCPDTGSETSKPTPRPTQTPASLPSQTVDTSMAGAVHDKLSAYSASGCNAELFRCPNGQFVGRDPANQCEYFPCKLDVHISECSAELFRCSNGRYVGRNPAKECEYFSCEVDGDISELSEQSASMSSAAMTHEKFTSNLNQSLRTHKKGRQTGS
ncbi:hypothetical protein ACHAWT_008020 [Skeletonema menzelii]